MYIWGPGPTNLKVSLPTPPSTPDTVHVANAPAGTVVRSAKLIHKTFQKGGNPLKPSPPWDNRVGQMGGNITLRSPPSNDTSRYCNLKLLLGDNIMQKVNPILVFPSSRIPFVDKHAHFFDKFKTKQMRRRRTGFKKASMLSSFGTQRRFGQGTRRIRRQRTERRTPVVVVQPGFTRNAGFFGRFGPGGELKFKDQDFNSGTIAVGAQVLEASIVDIAQGTGETERIGRKCTIRSINWRFQITMPVQSNTATPGYDTIRVIMFLDKQCNGATADDLDLLESADYQSFNNLANKSRFRTLMDRTYDLTVIAATGADATGEWAGNVISDTLFKKVNIPIEYDSTTGAITEIRSNNIGILLCSSGGLSQLVSKIRLRFSDT